MTLHLRGGGDVDPPAHTFGPVNGAPWVRDHAVAQAVTQPAGTIVTVDPGELTQALLTANPGATFWLTKGTHTISSSLTPLADQKFYLESAFGTRDSTNSAVLDAGDADLSGHIFGGTVAGVEIHGGVWTGLGTTASGTDTWRAAIRQTGTSGWVVEDAEIANNGQQGIRFSGSNFVARRLYIHDNGFYGINTVTDGTYRLTGGLMEYCHLKANSTAIHGIDVDAGQKFVHCDDSEFAYNWIENTEGTGLWWDFRHKDHHIHDNVIEGSWDVGLFFEYSYGGTEINNNYLQGNGEHYGTDSWFSAVQLLVSSTDATLGGDYAEVRVHHNLLDGTSKQMGVLELLGRPVPRGIRFYDNDVTWRGTSLVMELAGGESNGTTGVYTNGTNTFEDNYYHAVDQDLARWQWIGASGSAGVSKTWDQWKAYGHDVPGGTLDEVVT